MSYQFLLIFYLQKTTNPGHPGFAIDSTIGAKSKDAKTEHHYLTVTVTDAFKLGLFASRTVTVTSTGAPRGAATTPPLIVNTLPATVAVASCGFDEVTTYDPDPPVITTLLLVALFVPTSTLTDTAFGVSARPAVPQPGPLSLMVI